MNLYLKLERQEMCSQSISGVKVFLEKAPHSPPLWERTPLPHPPQHLWRIALHFHYTQMLRKLPFGQLWLVHPKI